MFTWTRHPQVIFAPDKNGIYPDCEWRTTLGNFSAVISISNNNVESKIYKAGKDKPIREAKTYKGWKRGSVIHEVNSLVFRTEDALKSLTAKEALNEELSDYLYDL